MPSDWTVLSSHGIYASDYPDVDFIDYCFIDDTGGHDAANITKDCVYDFSENSFFGLSYFFESDGVDNAFLNGTLYGATPTTLTGPQDLAFLYDQGKATIATINNTFTTIAQSMSSCIRVGGEPDYSTPAYGQIMITQTLIRVEWPWLALPCTLVLLTLLVFVATIIETDIRGRKPLAETFSLALLLRGVAGDVHDQIDDSRYTHTVTNDFHNLEESQELIRKSAEQTNVRMMKTKLGYRLVKV
ncbi:hypothetical protein MMC26_004318 [Xylographa opegraphella]|nr:hypothetical protein [Xylographa opegraphella]